jgi:ribosomal protein S27E
MRRFLVVRCKGCDADLIFREVAAGNPLPYILGTGLAKCPGCHQEHEYFNEDVRTIEASEE